MTFENFESNRYIFIIPLDFLIKYFTNDSEISYLIYNIQ